jgi:hypothetical protein
MLREYRASTLRKHFMKGEWILTTFDDIPSKQAFTKKFVQHFAETENPQIGEVFQVQPSGTYYKINLITTVGFYDYYHCDMVDEDDTLETVGISPQKNLGGEDMAALLAVVLELERRVDALEEDLSETRSMIRYNKERIENASLGVAIMPDSHFHDFTQDTLRSGTGYRELAHG